MTLRRRPTLLAPILLAAASTLRAQAVPEAAASEERPALEILEPTSAATPVGDTLIRVFARGTRPGDTMDFFVDGRKVGAAAGPPWEATWAAGETVRRHVVTIALLRAGREIATARVNTREPGFTDRAMASAVALAPIVTDRSGRYILGLQKADFTVLDNGRPQQIDTFDAVDSPLAVVLVLDVSASMQPRLDEATRAARLFVQAVKPDDRVGLVTFSTGIVESVRLAHDRKPVLAALESARPEAETALYDAIAAALRQLKGVSQRKAVVVFTDGEDNHSRLSVDQVIDMARGSEVCIYAVAETASDAKLAQFLERLADETGGRSYPIAHVRKLPGTFSAIVKELRSQYFLTYTPSNRRPHTWHSVDVRVNRPGVVARAKKRYRVP
jgi:Ca-activated chloride channel family protein